MKKEELTKLIEDAMKGDLNAFEEVMAQKGKQIVYIAVELMKDPQDGEDAAQEAMLKMYQHLNDLKDPSAFQRWMYQIVTRTCIDLKRKHIREDYDYLELEEEVKEVRREFLPQEYIEDVDKREFLMSIINDLPENYRIGLLLFYYEDMSYQQIAELMGISEKTVDNILQRGKKRIKEKLERKYGDGLKLLALNAVSVPVIGQAFHMDAVMRTSPEAVDRVLAEVSTRLAELAAAAAATGTAAMATAGSTQAAASSGTAASAIPSASAASSVSAAGGTAATVKAAVGITVALTVAAGTALAVFPGNEEPSMILKEYPAQEEMAILTLEDMIGQELADQLRDYAAGEGEWQDWDAFIEVLDAKEAAGIVTGSAQYTLYHLEKQDKQLMILEEKKDNGIEIVFLFTESHEEQPKEFELLRSMDRWRQ